MLTRRSLLASAAVVPLAGCSTVQIQTIEQQIIDTVQAFEATACGIIPTAQTILAVIAGFGVSLASVGAVVLQQVEQAICNAVPPPASARYRSLPFRTSGAPPAVIGNAPTPSGNVVVNGWRTR
jgi:hypothetical protein